MGDIVTTTGKFNHDNKSVHIFGLTESHFSQRSDIPSAEGTDRWIPYFEFAILISGATSHPYKEWKNNFNKRRLFEDCEKENINKNLINTLIAN